ETPEPSDDRRRHAVLLLLAREGGGVLLHLRLPVRHAPAGQHLVGELQKVLREELLPAIDVHDALVVDQIGRRRRDRGARDALLLRLLLELGEPGVEIAGVAAGGDLRPGAAGADEQHPPGERRAQGYRWSASHDWPTRPFS